MPHTASVQFQLGAAGSHAQVMLGQDPVLLIRDSYSLPARDCAPPRSVHPKSGRLARQFGRSALLMASFLHESIHVAVHRYNGGCPSKTLLKPEGNPWLYNLADGVDCWIASEAGQDDLDDVSVDPNNGGWPGWAHINFCESIGVDIDECWVSVAAMRSMRRQPTAPNAMLGPNLTTGLKHLRQMRPICQDCALSCFGKQPKMR